MKYSKKDYTDRIRNASPSQLVVITFELTIVNLEDAKNAKNEEDFETHIKKAQEFLMQLMTSLDMGYAISGNLLSIYIYTNKLLHEAFFTKNIENVDISIGLLNSLMESFITVSNKSAKRSEEMFPSFTLKNGRFDEYEVEDINSGFKA